MPVARRNLLVAAVIAVLAAGLALLFFALPESGPGFWSGLVLEIQTVQRDLHRQLATAMQAVQAEGAAAAWALVVLSFLYGVFHAAGPGHGKVVISTYLLTQESHLRRGVCPLRVGLRARKCSEGSAAARRLRVRGIRCSSLHLGRSRRLVQGRELPGLQCVGA